MRVRPDMRRYASAAWICALCIGAIGFTGCDMVVPPEEETNLDNPRDPVSPTTHIPPETTIASGPANGSTITTSTVTITYESNADLFQTRLNTGTWSTWSSDTSTTLTYLDEAQYSFDVRSAYEPGEGEPTVIDETPASVTFTVDAVSGPSLRFSPSFREINQGSEFVLELIAEEVSDLMAVRATVQFDPDVLTTIDVTKGSFFTSTGGSQALYYTIDDVNGVLEIDIGTAAGSPAGVTGSGTIATLTFRGDTQNEIDVTFDLSATAFRDSNNQPITISNLVGARVRVR